ncbi:unnamed protein product, partial [Prorocentrum cordatum]
DLDYAVAYFDLAECFEYVTHVKAKAWGAGPRWGFNRITLIMVLRIYPAVRVIALEDCCAQGGRWARCIVAGNRFAPFCLQTVILVELDG